jgi:hypothetical protein
MARELITKMKRLTRIGCTPSVRVQTVGCLVWKRYSHHFQGKGGWIAERTLPRFCDSHGQFNVPSRSEIAEELRATRFNEPRTQPINQISVHVIFGSSDFWKKNSKNTRYRRRNKLLRRLPLSGIPSLLRAPEHVRRMNSEINLGYCREGWMLYEMTKTVYSLRLISWKDSGRSRLFGPLIEHAPLHRSRGVGPSHWGICTRTKIRAAN